MRLDEKAGLVTSGEAARVLGVGRVTVSRMCRAGDLPAIRIGERGRWRIRRCDLDQLVQSEQKS